jgi:hypothetical protein
VPAPASEARVPRGRKMIANVGNRT